MSIAGLVKGRGPSGFGYGSTAEEVTQGIDLSGKTFLVTGVASGLGLETIRVLSMRGANVVALARTQEAAAAAMASVAAKGMPVACDLSEPGSVRAAAATVKKSGPPLDSIVCNAGVMAIARRTVKHGLEMQFLTNHVGHFLLVTGILERLDGQGRVVILSSEAHRMAPPEGIRLDDLDAARGYSPWTAYGQSKLANALFARELAKRVGGKRTANSLHPGVIKTKLGRHMPLGVRIAMSVTGPLWLKSIPQGAATQCYVATNPALAGVSGEYFSDCNIARPTRLAQDDSLAGKLWSKTEELASRF